MNRRKLTNFNIKDMTISYQEDSNGCCGMIIYPTAMEEKVLKDKEYVIEPLIQVKIIGDNYPFNYSQGRTMRNSQTTMEMKFEKQELIEEENRTIIKTYLNDSRGIKYIHYVENHKLSKAIEIKSEVINNAEKEITLEMLSSFTLGGLTPFIDGLAKDSMVLHQIRSTWSNEGRLVSLPIEEYQLEPSWKPSGANCFRFGQVGSMPNREYFPFVAVEDVKSGVCWGVQLAIASSWQIEAYRKDDALIISGGLADREKGHWMKKLQPGKSFITPKAVLSTVCGDVDLLCQRLTENIRKDLKLPKSEESMPLIFNEFCTTWGNPSEETIEDIVEKIKDKGIDYLVIDAGWDNPHDPNNQDLWKYNIGDWNCSEELFPIGMKNLSNKINDKNMKLGIWYEFEVAARDSKIFKEDEMFLSRDGYPITSGARRFLDMTNEEVIERLDKKVIDFIKESNIDYIKVDYNDNIGVGCDGYESLGEGLRQNILSTLDFFRKMKREIPELVIETCASGGQRLCIPFMEISSMASFSDAHECTSIPIIAANMHRMILPRQSQIWAVIQKEHSNDYLYYQIAAGMLGRLCLSGNITELDLKQWAIIQEGIQMYKNVSHLIDNGITYRYGSNISSYKEPEGYQIIVRRGSESEEVLVIVHTFEKSPGNITLNLDGNYEIKNNYYRKGIEVVFENNNLKIDYLKDFDGLVILLKKVGI